MKPAIIYIRTSTQEQNPKNQLKDCLEYCKNKDFEVIEVIEEKGSAYKQKKKRSLWDKAVKLSRERKYNIVLWRYDRAFRNMKEFVRFMGVMYEGFGIKVFSVCEEWVNILWEVSESIDLKRLPSPYDEIMKEDLKLQWKNQIRLIGMFAEEESRKKGERVKLAVRKKEGKPTKSYKGNIWGRKALSKKTVQKVLGLHKKGLSIRQIADQVYYWDSNKNKRKISKSAVHKIINEN